MGKPHVLVYCEPWTHTDTGAILDGDGKEIFLPASSTNYNSATHLAARVCACVNATKSLHNDTLKRSTLLIKPSADHVIMAATMDDIVDWCRSVLIEAGFDVPENPNPQNEDLNPGATT